MFQPHQSLVWLSQILTISSLVLQPRRPAIWPTNSYVTQPPLGFVLLDRTSHPLATLCEGFWGQMEKLQRIKPGEVIEITRNQLMSTGHLLYFFKPYRYKQQRVDALRLKDDMELQPHEGCVVVVGTRAIGERRSTYYHHLTAPLGQKDLPPLLTRSSACSEEHHNVLLSAHSISSLGIILSTTPPTSPTLVSRSGI